MPAPAVPIGLFGSTASSGAATPDVPVQLLASTLANYQQGLMYCEYITATFVVISLIIVVYCKPFWPFFISRTWTKKPVVGMMNKVRNIVPFNGFILKNGMYRKEWNNNILYHIKKFLGSQFLMGCSFDFVHMDKAFVIEPEINKYVVALQQVGYPNARAVRRAIMFNDIQDPETPGLDPDDRIGIMAFIQKMGYETYQEAKRAINPLGITPTTKIYAPRFSTIPFDIILGYGLDIAPGSVAMQIDDIFESRKPPVEENMWYDFLPFIIMLVGFGIAASMIIMAVR
jgi:hypothetical protein